MNTEKNIPENLERKETVESVPYIVYESAQVRNERNVKRMLIALVLAVVMLFASNLVWLYAWFSYDYESIETVTVDGKDGVASYIGNDGNVYNGESDGAESSQTN